jgi:hypothetical protein
MEDVVGTMAMMEEEADSWNLDVVGKMATGVIQ